ncbi:MAG TPA: TlyA family RNA methyltransferase [Candidatus Dormibacteraeota bacterium]|nr:TlyA family RNA methyltransferase [Candidatus Dormibacteraeota bacterium]
MAKTRLDQALVGRGLVSTRSQAESYIKLGKVTVNKQLVSKPGFLVAETDNLALTTEERYVSRAALKLGSAAENLKLNFGDKTVLDVGSSTGGFTDYALQHGAARAIAVEVGTQQLHPSLRGHPSIELHEQTDIRSVNNLSTTPDIVLIDVSFISLREILPHLTTLISKQTVVVAMVKPQFEAQQSSLKHKGVIKNDTMRRQILKDFEAWVQQAWLIEGKADSAIKGAKGNLERFYLLKKH